MIVIQEKPLGIRRQYGYKRWVLLYRHRMYYDGTDIDHRFEFLSKDRCVKLLDFTFYLFVCSVD